MPNNEYKDRYLDSIENDIKDGKEERNDIDRRLRIVEEQSHVHNGDKSQKDLPRALKDKEVIKFIIILIIVLIAAGVLWTTGENLLGGL